MGYLKTCFFLFLFCFSFSWSLTCWGLDEPSSQELIVKIRSQSPGKKSFLKKSTNYGVSVQKSWSTFNMHQVKIKEGQSMEKAILQLGRDPNVEYVEPNYTYRKLSLDEKGPELTMEQVQALAGGFTDTEKINGDGQQEGDQEPLDSAGIQPKMSSFFSFGRQRQKLFTQLLRDQMNVEKAWQLLSPESPAHGERKRPIIGVADTGVDCSHKVFLALKACWINKNEIPDNGIDDDNNGYVDDVWGWNFVNRNNNPVDDDNHGTHVAATALGMTQNIMSDEILKSSGDPSELGLESSKVRIMALKILDQEGKGKASDAIAAIEYAINNGVHIINASWGEQYRYSQALVEAIDRANDEGVLFIVAAGNSSNNNDEKPVYPSSYTTPNIISVTATTSRNILASFSNFGSNSVHLGSQGVGVLSAIPGNRFKYLSGTSMATPFVSGLVALMMRESEFVTNHQIQGILFEQSQKTVDLQGKVSSESIIDSEGSLMFLKSVDLSRYAPKLPIRSINADDESPALGGCATVGRVLKDHNQKTPRNSSPVVPLVLLIVLSPMGLILFLKIRSQRQMEERRKYRRYMVDVGAQVCIGGDFVQGRLNSLSMGGVELETSLQLEKETVISLKIQGSTELVQARVVWCGANQHYGLEFCGKTQELFPSLRSWFRILQLSAQPLE